MKKIYTILVCIWLLAGFVACEKDKDFALTTLTVQNETITPSYGSATIDCSFKSDATISEAFVQYSLSSSFAKYDVAKMTEEKGKYAAQLTGLADNTTYYIRYAVSNKYSSAVTEEVIEFQTLQCTAPTVILDSIADVWDNHAKAYIHLTFDGGASVTDMGVCWGTQTNPTIKDIHISTEDTLAVLDITSLQSNTKYYVRAYAMNKVGVAYSEEKEFTTLALPEVRTEDVSDIQVNTALLSATLLFDGNDTATVKGFCWSDKADPTIDGNHITVDTTSAHYTYVLSKLLLATEYHVRAYAQNKIGVVYGEEKTFTTSSEIALPTVTTAIVTQITETSAVASGNVTSDGGASVTERGVCISTVSNPTISNIKITAGSGIGSFTCNLTGLQANTTYYVRAYAVNSKGTAYGEEVSFTTSKQIVLPSVTTATVTQITETSAVAGGNVTSDGGASVTDRGVVYSTNQHPTVADNKVSNGSGMGSFTCNLTNLLPNTKYYVRAYAVNSQGTAYGEEMTFATEEEVIAIPEYVDLGLSVKWATFNVGASKPEEYGDYFAWGEVEPKSEYSWSTYKWCNGYETALIKYNTDEWYGTVDNKIIIESEDDAATKNWGNDWRLPNKYEIDELRDKCTWSWINRNGTYGYQVTGPSGKSIFLPATRYRDGVEQSGVSTYGSYWSSTLYTSITAWHLGFYSDYGNTYADKRYTGRAVRPVYGSRMDVPNITTSAITQITETTAVVGGNVTSDGGASVTERGVVYATTQNPTTNNTKVTNGTGIGSFTCNLTGLLPNTTYYVRAYATNEVGTTYGEEMSFTTETPAVPEYVDLGLSVKWATFNVGASKPEEYGDYFAWGEVEPKSTNDWSTYQWCNGSHLTLTKYCTNGSFGAVDNRTQLELTDDAAHANWDGNWRMPTYAELTELHEQCTWTWITQNGVNGYKVTSKTNGNSIFLPAAGTGIAADESAGSAGFYWSSSLNVEYPTDAWGLLCFLDHVYIEYENSRSFGLSVRPVWGEYVTEVTVPTIITTTVTQITETSAVAGGNVTSDGGESVTERGVVYSTNPNPVITNLSNTIRPCGSGTGVFTYTIYGLQSGTTYYVRAYAKNDVGTAYGEEVSFTTKEQSSIPSNGTENGHEYVDLGLSVKWATCNVGASYPEDYGDYFAWGETTTKSTYNWSTYKHCNNSKYVLKKYNTFGDYGVVDNKTILELSDDAAHVNMGGEWRMPTETEWAELREQCTWTWSTQDGINGYKVISNINGNSIFFPTAGCSNNIDVGIAGYYWSIKLYTTYYQTYNAYYYHLSSSQSAGVNHDERYKGMSIRAICP